MPIGMTWERAMEIAKKRYPKLSLIRQKRIAAKIWRGARQKKPQLKARLKKLTS